MVSKKRGRKHPLSTTKKHSRLQEEADKSYRLNAERMILQSKNTNVGEELMFS